MLDSRAMPGERVAAGLRVLSRVTPPWWVEGGENEVDPDTLDMSDPLRNLLAQRFGSVKAGLERLDLTEDDAIGCGFVAVDAEDAVLLRRLWLLHLNSSRREVRSFPPPPWPAGATGPDEDPPGRWYL